LPPGAGFRAGVGLTFHNDHVGVDFGFGLSAGCFTFVAYDHFRDSHPDHFRMPHHEVERIYHSSTVVNNYTVVNKTTIITATSGSVMPFSLSRTDHLVPVFMLNL
jgi:hypothetical protein